MLYDPNWKPNDAPIIKRTDLTEQETKALLRVRTALHDGTISAKQFQMDTTAGVRSRSKCGTHGCIGGWMGLFAMYDDGVKLKTHSGNVVPGVIWDRYFTHMHDPKFDALFLPLGYSNLHFHWAYDHATPQDGVRAIDNFLAGEEDPWKDWSAE